MWRHRRTGGRRALEERARKAEERARELERAFLAAVGEGGSIPPELEAAASMAGPDGQAVRTVIDGQEVIVVVGNEGGSAPEWHEAIRSRIGRIAS